MESMRYAYNVALLFGHLLSKKIKGRIFEKDSCDIRIDKKIKKVQNCYGKLGGKSNNTFSIITSWKVDFSNHLLQ